MRNHTRLTLSLSSAEVTDLATACHRLGCNGPACYQDRFIKLRDKVLDQALNRESRTPLHRNEEAA